MGQTSAYRNGDRMGSGISGNGLKLFAAVTMVIDHIGAGLVEPYWNKCYEGAVKSASMELLQTLGNVDLALRLVGRLSFPVFCFLLVEGFLHTRDWKKYAGRLFVFGLLSELPFDRLFFGSWFNPEHQNVYPTLFIALLVLVGYQRYVFDPLKKYLVVLAGCGTAYLLRCDYDAFGILLVVVLYEFHGNKTMQALAGGLMAGVQSISFWGASALAFIPIHMYNGKKGRLNLKYFFYWFYPVHLAVLCLIRIVFLDRALF